MIVKGLNFFRVLTLTFCVVSVRSNNVADNFYYGSCSSGFEPNPADCSTYFQCNFGSRLLLHCPPSLHWNTKITACDWPATANCQESPVEQEPIEEQPNDLEFEPVGPVVAPPVVEPVESCAEGTYWQDSTNCGSYFICVHSKPVAQHCGAGLYWNNQLHLCDWPTASNCGTSSTGPDQGSLPPPPAVIEPPPTQLVTTTPATTAVEAPVPVPVPAVPTPWTSGLKLVCYFTDWAWYRPAPSGKFLPANIDPSLCTHIVYAFGLLNGNDFVIQPADTWADFDNHFYENVTSLKSRGIKVTLALGGWNDSGGNKYSLLVNDPTKRAGFITSTIDYLQKYNFDGLDLDWEYPSCWQGNCRSDTGDKEGFAALVRELRAALPAGYILSAAVSASQTIIDAAYDVPTLSNYLDWIGVMDYDFHGNWDRQTGHVAPLYFMEGDSVAFYNVNSSIAYWLEQGAAPEKLIMGIPLYGQSFTLSSSANHGLNAPTSGPGAAGDFTRQGGVLSYYEICSKSWNIVQDPEGRMGPYGYNGNQWVSFDDVVMVTKKANYAKAKGLGGGMIWALDMDDFTNLCGQGTYPLLTAISNVLKS